MFSYGSTYIDLGFVSPLSWHSHRRRGGRPFKVGKLDNASRHVMRKRARRIGKQECAVWRD